MNPWPVAEDKKSDQRHWDRVSYTPVAGRLILFPSWLEHDVEANMSDHERISISFNMNLRKAGLKDRLCFIYMCHCSKEHNTKRSAKTNGPVQAALGQSPHVWFNLS